MMHYTFEDGNGDAIKAAVISDPDGSMAVKYLNAMGRFGVQKADSSQVPSDGMGAYYEAYAVEPPPVLPYFYSELYRRDDTVRACVDARVEAVAKQGWRIRPRSEVWPGLHAGDPRPRSKELDYDLQDRIIQFFEGGLPDYDFSEMLSACWLDLMTTGNMYIELIRDARGKLVKMARAPSVTMRIARGVPGFVQQRGHNKQWFVRYGQDAKAIRLRRKDQEPLRTKEGSELLSQQPLFLPVSLGEGSASDFVPGNNFQDWLRKARSDGDEITTKVSEIIHVKIPTPKDISYGEPPILSAVESFLGGQNARLFMLSYFDNATVPRMAIFIKGDGALNQQVLQRIDDWMSSQNKLDALNQVLVVEVGEGTDVTVERMSSEQLRDDGGFLRYKETCSQAIRRAYRTPPSVTFDLEGLNRAVSSEADRKYLELVVRPDQRLVEARFNNLIEREFNTRDWVLDLTVPDLSMIQERRQLWEMLLLRGAISINEVRRELGRPSIPGGDVPILFIPGQGYVPLDAFADRGGVKEMLDSGRGEMETSDLKTPPKAAINVSAGQELSTGLQFEFAHLAEQLGVGTPEERAAAFPEAFPAT